MCGLALVAALNGSSLTPAHHSGLEKMVHCVAHRGPDEQDYFTDPRAALGFTRLSLIGPDNGNQPIVAPDGSCALIANGEVYNYQALAAGLASKATMRTSSDCEVLAHLYAEKGRHFLDDVNGMYAIMLIDRRRNKIVLAQDRFGIKPLYFHRNAERVVAASEIKALFCDPDVPRQVDWSAALGSSLLAASPTISDDTYTTWFRDVETVPPGTILEIDMSDGFTRSHRYWAFPAAAQDSAGRDVRDYVEEYGRLLTESVHDCATADVSIGLFLSGGIDSAAVAALARDVADVHTFTAVNAGTLANGDVEFSDRLARELGLENHMVLFEPEHGPTPAEWKRLLWQLETPLCGPEVFYKHELHRYAKSAVPDVKAMLLGAASDEFNGGYSRGLAGGDGWTGFMDSLEFMRRRGALLTRPALRPWAEDHGPNLLSDAALGLEHDTYQAYVEAQARKIAQYNVWHEDRSAAGSGIEARVPFLDHRLVELSVGIPPALRSQLLWDKQILRDAMTGVLPTEFVRRPKVPFFYGPGTTVVYRDFGRLLRQDGAALVHEALAQPGAAALDADAVLTMLARVSQSPSADVELLLRLVNLALLESMAADLPAARVDLPVAELPRRVDVRGDAADLSRRLGLDELVDLAGPLQLSDDVLLARTEDGTGDLFVIVDGTLEYVVDDQRWAEVLRGVDGVTPLRDVLDRAGLPLADALDFLHPALAEGLMIDETAAAPLSR